MKTILFITTILLVVFFIPKIVSAGVVINEVAWMGTENSSSDEWIELYNNGDEIVDITGWILEAVDETPFINLEGNIPANGYFLLERTDDSSVPSITADQIYTGALGNTGEYLKLKNASNNTINEINASEKWPAGNNSTKQTMERIADGWQTSSDPGGTPKAQNSSGAVEEPEGSEEEADLLAEETGEMEAPPIIAGNNPPIADAGDNIIGFIGQEISFDGSNCSDPDEDELAFSWNMGDGKLIEEPSFTYTYLYPGTYLVTLMVYDGLYYISDTITVKIQSQQITINEFIPNPEGSDEENEWIEIYNDSDSIVDIGGWQLDDSGEGSKPFTFPQNTLIAPKSYIVFPRPITKIALNNDEDSVRLLLPEGIVFQEIQYSKSKEGQSSANTPEGFVWSIPTPGIANITYPEAVGGSPGIAPKQTAFNYQVEPEITREPDYDSSWYYEAPEGRIEGGYIEDQSSYVKTSEDELAMVLTENKITKLTEPKQASKNTQSTVNLVLMIAAVILGAFIIGLLITKFLKRSP